MADNEPTHQPADAVPPDEDLKSQTSRISLDSARPLKSPLEVKKSTNLVPGIPTTHAGPIPQTIRLKRPPTSPITVRPDNLTAAAKKPGDTALVQAPTTARPVTAETGKRQTSRIGLTESAAPKSPTDFKRTTGPILGIPTHAGPIPQTIRLKRPPTSPVMRPPTSPVQPAGSTVTPPAAPLTKDGIQAVTEAPTFVKHLDMPKSQTSRIVLEDAMVPISVAGATQPTVEMPLLTTAEPPAPKTIRLKRPSSLSEGEENLQAMAGDETLQTAKKGETAKIELPVEDTTLTPITQRKTIKIKRTDRTVTTHAGTPETAAAPEPSARMEAPAPEAEEALVFPLVAIAATLCIAALVYIMVAQAFGIHMPLPASMQLH